MSRIINTAKVLRRNWKKSTFFFGVFAYGVSYFNDKYQTHQMMRAYCEEAKKYGERPLSQMIKPKHVTVILNPEANYKKSNVQFEKFAAPLLHLAGFKVSVFQTEKEKQAQELMQVMSNTDAVLVAGGNGTLQEVVTGLLLRPNVEENKLPLGIVPLGKTNTVAEYLFGEKASSRAQLMAEAVMAVIRERTVNLDVLKVQFTDEDKPVFAMVNFEQGIFADVEPLVQKYWYLGALKDRFTYFINSFKEWKSIENKSLEYVAPCTGCSKCYVAPKRREKAEYTGRWWQVFVPRTIETKAADTSHDESVSAKINEDCGKRIALIPEYSSISVSTTAVNHNKIDKSGTLSVKVFPKDLSMNKFISSGLSHRKSKHQDTTGIANVVEAREIIIQTVTSHETESFHVDQKVHSDVTETSNLVSVTSPNLDNAESSNSSNSVLSSSDNVDSVDLVQQTESIPSVQTENSNKETQSDQEDTNQFSYIDNEKYRRASCSISVLPRQVTVYG